MAEAAQNTDLMEWTFSIQCKIPQEIQQDLVQGEQALFAYKTIRDVAVFTTKRILVRDSQGLTGKKTTTICLPYRSITMYSVETSGVFDFTGVVELWTKAGRIKINLGRDINMKEFSKAVATAIL